MEWLIKTNKENKQEFYSNPKNVEHYEHLRFSNPGGKFVHELEESLFTQFLSQCPHNDSILDIPCGTGRLIKSLQNLNFTPILASDYSSEMLKVCRSAWPSDEVTFSKQDIYHTTFTTHSFSAILSSRFMFHSEDQNLLFSEFNRLLITGGYLVFDTLNWSPRTWTNHFSVKLGGNICTNSYPSVIELAKANGFEVLASESILAFPSFVYNFIPGFTLGLIKRVEFTWPNAWKSKRIWLLKKL